MTRRKYRLKLTKEIYQVLMSKLRVNHREYYKDAVGLNMPIEFKGYPGTVLASIPYSNEPVAFYKWWKSPRMPIRSHFLRLRLSVFWSKSTRWSPTLFWSSTSK